MKQVLRVSLFAVLMLAVFSVFAQENGGNFGGDAPRGNRDSGRRGGRGQGFRGDRGPRGGREMGPRGNFGMRMNPRAEIEKKLKEKYPAEFAEIERLRAEADKKVEALAKKENIELPAKPKSMDEIMAELKKKYPKEMAEIEALQKTDRRAAFMKLRELMMKENGGRPFRGDAPAMRDNPQRTLRAAQKKYPEEWREIQRIRRTDPAKARQMTKELLEKYQRESKK